MIGLLWRAAAKEILKAGAVAFAAAVATGLAEKAVEHWLPDEDADDEEKEGSNDQA